MPSVTSIVDERTAGVGQDAVDLGDRGRAAAQPLEQRRAARRQADGFAGGDDLHGRAAGAHHERRLAAQRCGRRRPGIGEPVEVGEDLVGDGARDGERVVAHQIARGAHAAPRSSRASSSVTVAAKRSGKAGSMPAARQGTAQLDLRDGGELQRALDQVDRAQRQQREGDVQHRLCAVAAS